MGDFQHGGENPLAWASAGAGKPEPGSGREGACPSGLEAGTEVGGRRTLSKKRQLSLAAPGQLGGRRCVARSSQLWL